MLTWNVIRTKRNHLIWRPENLTVRRSKKARLVKILLKWICLEHLLFHKDFSTDNNHFSAEGWIHCIQCYMHICHAYSITYILSQTLILFIYVCISLCVCLFGFVCVCVCAVDWTLSSTLIWLHWLKILGNSSLLIKYAAIHMNSAYTL